MEFTRHTKTLAASLLAVFSLSLLTTLPHQAQAQTTTCDFGDTITKLKEIQALTNDGDQKSIVRELNARKNILKITLSCLKKDADDLDAQLSEIKNPSPEVSAFAEWIHRQIEENISFYNYKQTQIDNLGLKGAKDFAKDISERRKQIDEPLDSLVSTLLNWTDSQALFEVGGKRFKDIKKTLDAFSLPGDHEIVALEKEALTIFDQAVLQNRKAWQSLANHEVEKSHAFTKESLEKLSQSYTVLLKISDASKKILPL